MQSEMDVTKHWTTQVQKSENIDNVIERWKQVDEKQ